MPLLGKQRIITLDTSKTFGHPNDALEAAGYQFRYMYRQKNGRDREVYAGPQGTEDAAKLFVREMIQLVPGHPYLYQSVTLRELKGDG